MLEIVYLSAWQNVTCSANNAWNAATGLMAVQVCFDQFQCLQGMLTAGVHHHEAQLDCLFFSCGTGKHGLQQQMTCQRYTTINDSFSPWKVTCTGN